MNTITCTPEYTPITKEGLSQHTIDFLQRYCDMRNNCVKQTPELYEDEPYKVLTVENMAATHMCSALEMEVNAFYGGAIADEDMDLTVINELEEFLFYVA
ncbi:hypothetical protein DSECCO2_266350 [anaerobic digester metagenome]